ncbi:MAG: DUF4440 domain-containing protein [Granulosicoccus sp.]
MANSPDANTANAISATNRRFEAALASKNAVAAAGVYTSTGTIMPPNHPIVSGHEDRVKFWTNVLESGVGSAELTTVELDQVGDSVNEIGKFVLKDTDGNVADEGKFIVIWKRENGEWLWHHDCFCSSLAPA